MSRTVLRASAFASLAVLLIALALSVTAASAQTVLNPRQPRNLITNGGFESGTDGWSRVESPLSTSLRHHCGRSSVNFGWLGDGAILQELTIPLTAPRADLGYWLLREGTGSAELWVQVYPPVSSGPSAPPLVTLPVHSAANTAANTWSWRGADLAAFKGQVIRLQFTLSGFDPANPTHFFLDDVELWTNFIIAGTWPELLVP